MHLHAFDLLTKMLEIDPSRRISADSALSHPYFAEAMDIEVETKLFKSVSNKALFLLEKDLMTPSTGFRKTPNTK